MEDSIEEASVGFPVSLADIPTPQAPDDVKSQIADDDLLKTESPKPLKPVLGKLQAKKRLMAFAKKYTVIPNPLPKAPKIKNKAQNKKNSEDGRNKSKMLAIEEIVREENKHRLLLAQTLAAEERSIRSRRGPLGYRRKSNSRERKSRNSYHSRPSDRKYDRKRHRSREKRDDRPLKDNKDRKEIKEHSTEKFPPDKDSRKKDTKDERDNRDITSERLNDVTKEKIENVKVKRDETKDKVEENKDKKEESKIKEDKKEKKDETKVKRDESRDRRENEKSKRDESRRKREEEKRDKRENSRDKSSKEKGRDREKDLNKCNSWADLRKVGLSIDEVTRIKKAESTEKSEKARTPQDFADLFGQMLLLGDHRKHRSSYVAQGLEGPKEYPPETVRVTKARPAILYSENPQVSLLLDRRQVLNVVPPERREKMSDICEATQIRIADTSNEDTSKNRAWYRTIDSSKSGAESPVNVQFPKSKWDSEEEGEIADETESQGDSTVVNEVSAKNSPMQVEFELKNINETLEDVNKKEKMVDKVEKEDSIDEEKVPEEREVEEVEEGEVQEIDGDEDKDDEDKVDEDKDDEDEDDEDENDTDDSNSDVDMEKSDKPQSSPSVKSVGDEKLASEYEQFMKMVATESPSKSTSFSSKHSSKVTSSAVSHSNYEFEILMDVSRAKDSKFVEQLPAEDQTTKPKVKLEENLQKECLKVLIETESVSQPIRTLDESNEEPSEKENSEDEDNDEAPEENLDSDSRSIPSDWENVTIKVEQLSDENTETKTLKKKKKKERSYSTSSDSSSSSSSSDSDVKSKKRRKKKKAAKSSSDSESSDSSSSDSSSSDEARKKKRKRSRKKKRVKKSRKARKKRSRKRADLSSSDSEDARKKKKRLKRKKLKKKVVEVKEEGVRKRKRKSSSRSLSQDKKIKRAHVDKVAVEEKKKRKKRLQKAKRVKLSNDLEKQILAKALSPDSVLLKECDMGKEQNLIQEQAQARRKQKKMKKQQSEDLLSEWEKESILMTRQIEGIMDQSMSLDESPEREGVAKEEIGVRKVINRVEKDKEEMQEVVEKEREKVKEILDEKHFERDGIPLTIELKGKQEEIEKVDEDKSLSEEFLADWEKESQRITKVLEKETLDFHSLNVPSLTQLKEEVGKRDIFDEWEVDSLESVRESPTKKKNSKKDKVMYDEKTDAYITVQRDGSKDNKKKPERLSTIRIWEEEQEEGEREEMLLIKQKTKRNMEDWNTEEEFSKMRSDKPLEINTDDLLQTNLSEEMIKNEKNNSLEGSEGRESPKKELGERRRKKSRWDVGNQPEDSDDIQMTPVMWEDENTDWQKTSNTETALLKLAKVKEQISSPILKMLPGEIKLQDFNIAEVSSLDLIDAESPDVFQRKLHKMGLSENVWLAKRFDQKLPIVEGSEIPVDSKTEVEESMKLKNIVELQEQQLKNVDLYSPSSPALSQRSEEVSSESIEIGESKRRKIEERPLVLNPDTSICNIPLPSETITKTSISPLVKEESVRTIGNWMEEKSCDDPNKYNDLQLDSLIPEVEDLKETHVETSTESKFIKVNEIESLNHVDNTTLPEVQKVMESPSKIALKLIPKQLLIRRPIEQGKIKGLMQSNLNEVFENPSDYDDDASSRADSKSEFGDRGLANKFESPKGDRVEIAKLVKSGHRSDSRDRLPSKKDKDSDSSIRSKSPLRDLRRSPRKDRDKRDGDDRSKSRGSYYNDSRDKDREKGRSEKEFRNMKPIYNDNRKRASPPIGRGKQKRGASPWEDERSRSRSRSKDRSRSRSFSRSPRRRDGSRERDKKLDDDRFSRGYKFGDERRERVTRSPSKAYKDNRKRLPLRESPIRSDRDRGKRRYGDSVECERDRETKHYDPMEILREKSLDSERLRNNRFRNDDEPQKSYWQVEDDSIRRDGEEYIDSYINSQNPTLDYEDRFFIRNRSLDRDVEDPLRSSSKTRNTIRSRTGSNDRRDRTWEKNRLSPALERGGSSHRRGDKLPPRRSSPRRRSPARLSRYGSRSRSRSWSKTRSRSRSRTRSRSRSRSRSISSSRSRSRARLRSPDRAPRSLNRDRSLSAERSRSVHDERLREDEDKQKLSDSSASCLNRGRPIENIIQLTGGTDSVTDPAAMESEAIANECVDNLNSSHFRYASETETGNEYSYYPRNNLTYPLRIDETPTSPKRLSLDERLELELGIKKPAQSGEYLPVNFNSVPGYPPSPSVQQHRPFHQPSTVLQVGNVLQVVPGDYSGISVPGVVRSEMSPASSAASSKVVRVGNVLQVVPTTSIDWSGNPQPGIDRKSGARYPIGVPPAPLNVPISVPMSVPVPVPLPVPLPVSVNPSGFGTNISSISLSLPMPMPLPISLPITATTMTQVKKITTPPKEVPTMPVYDYEAILEVRRREKEERKRVREERKREKERRKLEKAKRRAEHMQGKRLLIRRPDIDQKRLDRLKKRHMAEELAESEAAINIEEEKIEDEKEGVEEDIANSVSPVLQGEKSTGEGEEEEEEDEEEEDPEVEIEAEDYEEEDGDEEDEEEEEDEDKKSSPLVQLNDIPMAAEVEEAIQIDVDVEVRDWPSLPPPPLKGILVTPGFGVVLNGDAEDIFEQENDLEEREELEEEDLKLREAAEEENIDNGVDEKMKSQARKRQTRAQRLRRAKKNVQFADGVKPGEGTSPSGGEGDLPSPPPPTTGTISKDGVLELIRKSRTRKSRRKQKRAKSSKTKKKVKVKIIKLKKPRITPLTALMLEDSDEADDRSPPPPPPGSPPPPHMWPSYLAAYNAALKTVTSNPLPPPAVPAQPRPPPTPLPLLVPPPPLNYTIQPCSKA